MLPNRRPVNAANKISAPAVSSVGADRGTVSPPAVRPRPRIRVNALIDGSCLATFGALKIKSSGSLGGNSARCSAATIANARPLSFAASVLTCPAYEFVRVRSRRALVTACPYPSLLK
jgi:hypothetical protein